MFAVAVAQPFAAPRATAPLRARAIPPAAVSPVSCSHVSTKTDSDASLPARSASGLVAAAVAVTMTLAPVYAADASDTVFAGRYIDPNHPHCPREIDADGVITGIDPVPFVKGSGCRGYKKKNEARDIEAGKIKPWQIKAKIAADDASIFIDFNQKDGSGESFTGKWIGTGIEFPDGNVWTRKELSTIP